MADDVKQVFIAKSFQSKTQAVIAQANAIIAEYMTQGFKLTLRQLYYQFVARALMPNTVQSYDRLGVILSDARLAGLIDWDAIEDRTRNVKFPSVWSSPESILEIVAEQYQENPWLAQKFHPEVWIEKEALSGVIVPVCERNRVASFACRGYTSQSEQYAAGMRLKRIWSDGRIPIIFHLGDHDPSGIDMTRDNQERLSMFVRAEVRVVRLALNRDQIDQYNPPPNPAKDTDIRFDKYKAEHGDQSWELDALDPTVIDALVQSAIDDIRDKKAWNLSIKEEAGRKKQLTALANNWDEIATYIDDSDLE